MTGRTAVLGAGNWGTTLADLIARNGHPVTLWTRTRAQAREINDERQNHAFTHDLVISEGVHATERLHEAIRDAPLVLIVIPSQAFRAVCRVAGRLLQPDQLVIHATKGLEDRTHLRMSQIVQQETCVRQLGVLSGPNIAPEIAAGNPAGTVIVSHFPRVIDAGRRALASPQLMVFSGRDVVGTELAAALKNIVAIAAGMANAMEVGENAKALLVTRGLAEITRLAVSFGANPATFSGLVGVGDLVVTCNSRQSRNHRVGEALARGESLPGILRRLGMVAEGVFAAKAAHEMAAAHSIDVPLIERVHSVLYEGLAPADGLRDLMQLPAGRDVQRFSRERHPAAQPRGPGQAGLFTPGAHP